MHTCPSKTEIEGKSNDYVGSEEAQDMGRTPPTCTVKLIVVVSVAVQHLI